MKWFRANTRHGSRLALFALLVQFALSFGHFHPLASARAAAAIQTGLTQADLVKSGTSDAANAAARKQLPSSPDNDPPPPHGGAICRVTGRAANVRFAAPPALQLPQAAEFRYLTT